MTHKVLWNFDVQMDHLMVTIIPDLMLINKENKNLSPSGFCSGPQNDKKKKDNEKFKRYEDLDRELKTIVQHEGNADSNCSLSAFNGSQKLGKGIKTDGYWR